MPTTGGSDDDSTFQSGDQGFSNMLKGRQDYTVAQLPGLNHDSAQTYGKPAAIAAALRQFFEA